jgi:hypothetical protein
MSSLPGVSEMEQLVFADPDGTRIEINFKRTDNQVR